MEEAPGAEGEAQAIEGYGCICGFRTPYAKEIRKHVFLGAGQDGAGVHKSLGRINLQTDEVIMPPWRERDKSQKDETRYGKRRTSAGDGSKQAPPTQRQTDVIEDASQVKYIPRIYTTDFTPIMRAARAFVVSEWGWRPDMPLQNLIDTIFYFFFKDRGVTLAGYIINEEAKAEIEAYQAALRAQGAQEPGAEGAQGG